MILKTLSNLYLLALKSRYCINIKGIENIKTDDVKIFLPNHQALIDPQILFPIIFKHNNIVPVVTDKFNSIPIIGWILKSVNAVFVKDIESGNRDINVLNNIIEQVNKALAEKRSILIYPSGQIAGQGQEKILNKQSAHLIVKNCDKSVKIIAVKINGLWGSMWSKAWNGESPSFLKTFIKGLILFLINFLFFIPKRKITIEFIDISNDAKEIANKSDRKDFNKFLESIYNSDGIEDVNYIGYHFLFRKLNRELPSKIKGSVNDIKDKNKNDLSLIPDNISDEIIDIISEIGKIEKDKISLKSNLYFDLGFDSLNIVSVILEIEKKYSIKNHPDITEIRIVADLCYFALNLLSYTDEYPPCYLNNQNIKTNNIRVKKDKTITENFIDTFSENNNEYFVFDSVFGTTKRKDFLLKALVISDIISKKTKDKYIGIMMPATQSTSLLIIATYLANKIPVMLNWTSGKTVLDYCINSLNVKTILTANAFYTKINDNISNETKEKLVFIEDFKHEITIKNKIKALTKACFPILIKNKENTDLNNPAVVLFTSGSEATPKAVVLTHKNIIENLWAVFDDIDISNDNILLGFLPPFHSFGYTISTISPLLTGLKVAYTPDPTNSKEVIKMLYWSKASIILGTPTFLRMILSVSRPNDLDSLSLIISGAESLSLELKEKLDIMTKGKAKVLEGYGITECSPVISINPPEKSKLNSVGKVIKNTKCLICDIDNFKILPNNEQGLILVKGSSIFNGYVDKNLPSPFVEVNNEMYFNTGDLGYLDDENYLYITGRLKRFIKIAGEMISLPFIEKILSAKYNTIDIPEIAISGTDETNHPIIVMFSIKDIDINEVNEFLKQQKISNLIKISGIVKVDSIPILGTGKIDYKELNKFFEK